MLCIITVNLICLQFHNHLKNINSNHFDKVDFTLLNNILHRQINKLILQINKVIKLKYKFVRPNHKRAQEILISCIHVPPAFRDRSIITVMLVHTNYRRTKIGLRASKVCFLRQELLFISILTTRRIGLPTYCCIWRHIT